MPAYLTRGGRQYNQTRRIHPRDSVSQLGYYLDNQASTSSSASSSKSVTSLLSSDVFVSTRRSARESQPGVNSPANSSGFSEETDLKTSESTVNKLKCNVQQGPVGGTNLSSPPRGAVSPKHIRKYAQDPIKTNSARQGANQPLKITLNSGRSGQNISRVKRRNFNRRMLILGEDHFVNPYALSELFSQSEIPGFREIFASDSYLRKFCWIVAFLFMTVLSLNDMTELITEYYEYPITVDVRQRDSSRLPFPSVTVCNLNVVRFSSLCNPSSDIRFDITNQIPSELRDKLCGIQVEKKKNNHSEDISDINNIGITTTTALPTTTTIGANSEVPLSGTTEGTPIKSPTTTELPKIVNQATSTAIMVSTSTSAEPRTTTVATEAPTTAASTVAPKLSTRRPPANGGLDLDEPALLMNEPQAKGPFWHSKWRGKRSIRFTDAGHLALDQSQLRPFASSKSQINIGRRNLQIHSSPLASASQFNKQGQPNNLLANRNNQNPQQPSVGQPPSRNGVALNPNLANNSPNTNNNNINSNVNTQSPFLIATNSQAPTTTANPFVPAALPEDFELTERQERELQENLTNWLAVMHNRDPELTLALGHQFDDMVLRCTMKSINCTHQRSFENSFSPTEGNCFTYRSRIKRRSSQSKAGRSQYEEAILAGTHQGLELVLNLEKNEYISGSSQVGALVMIHHPSDLGYAASEATFIAPEFTTYIGLKMVNITRLPAPYPEYCVDSWPAKFADKLTMNSTYSQQACFQICLQRTIQRHCQCQSAFLPIVEHDSDPTPAAPMPAPSGTNATGSNSTLSAMIAEATASALATTTFTPTSTTTTMATTTTTKATSRQPKPQRIIICDTRKLQTRQCVEEVRFRAADRVHHCECPPKCQVIRYDKTISMARWPTREDKVSFDRGKMDINFQNLAKVIVYFQTMTCEEVTQQALFNPAKLFSALGGIMGMYVGFSFLSVFEIFEVMSRKMWHYFKIKIPSSTSRLLVGHTSRA